MFKSTGKKLNNKVHVKTGDTVVVISGKYANGDKPVVGKVKAVSPEEGKVIVEGVHIVSKHVKPRRQGEAGGIVKTEGAIYASKVMLYCPKCGKGVKYATKIDENGKKIRVCKTKDCGEVL